MNNSIKELSKMSDSGIYRLCKKWGEEALHARRKFAGLLPEVNKRRLYERRGFMSIYEFAAKLSGMSREQVDVVLRMEKRFADKPNLHEALVEGKISVNKLSRVVSIATVSNQAQLAEKIEALSQKAVDIFVQDYKNKDDLQKSLAEANSNGSDSRDENALLKPLIEVKSTRAQTLILDLDVESKLMEMQQKGIDVNAFLRHALEKREQEIEEEKQRLAIAQKREEQEKDVIAMPVSRRVPVKIVRLIRAEYGTKCGIPNCNRMAKQLHHEIGFAKNGTHNPYFLKPLCKGHHELAHVNDKKVKQYRMTP